MSWEKSFFEVDLSRVKMPDVDPNWQQSHSYSRQQIDGWVRQLGEIQRLSVERGYTYKDFQCLRNSQVSTEREFGETHHKFYDHGYQTGNHDFVSLAWNGKEYQINNNGRHRVHSAKEIGLRRMPAEVSARTEHMAQLKLEGFSSSLMHPDDRADFSRSHAPSQQQSNRASSTPSSPSVPTRTDSRSVAGMPKGRVNR
jgi:pyocin large subunit-like protein